MMPSHLQKELNDYAASIRSKNRLDPFNSRQSVDLELIKENVTQVHEKQSHRLIGSLGYNKRFTASLIKLEPSQVTLKESLLKVPEYQSSGLMFNIESTANLAGLQITPD